MTDKFIPYEERLNQEGKKVLEIGAGYYPKPGATVTLDKCTDARVDIFRDFAKRGIPFADNTFDEVRAYDVIEHIELYTDFVFTMNEIYRVLKPGGLFHFVCPNGVDNTFSHITHFRVITSGNMLPYFSKSDSPEYTYMRKADGIEADFEMEFKEGADSSIMQGFFRARK